MRTEEINQIVSEHKHVIDSFNVEFYKSIKVGIDLIKETIINDSNIFLCGNGGSASDCQHFAAELVGRFKKDRRPYKAIALTTDSSLLTCISNDFSFENIFSRQLNAFGEKNDLLISISTSGESINVVNAINEAKNLGMNTLSFLGGEGGLAKKISKFNILVPSSSTARIQEVHILIIHIICQAIEDL